MAGPSRLKLAFSPTTLLLLGLFLGLCSNSYGRGGGGGDCDGGGGGGGGSKPNFPAQPPPAQSHSPSRSQAPSVPSAGGGERASDNRDSTRMVSAGEGLSAAEQREIREGVQRSLIYQDRARREAAVGGTNKYGLNVPGVGVGREADGELPRGRLAKFVRPPAAEQAESGWGRLSSFLGASRRVPAEEGSARAELGRVIPGMPPSVPGSRPEGRGSRDFAALLESGLLKYKMGDFQGALQDAVEAIAARPDAPDGYLLQAKVLNRMRNFAEAEKAALEAVKRGGGARAYEQAAWAELHMGKYKEAVANATKAIELDPKSADAYAIRAFAHERLGDRKAMLDDLRMAARLDPAKYGELLKRAEAGMTVFDPEDKESWRLLEGLAGGDLGSPGFGLRRLFGLLLLLLTALGGTLSIFRKRLEPLLAGMRSGSGVAAAFKDAGPEKPKAEVRPALPAEEKGPLGGKYTLGRPLPKGSGRGEAWEARDESLQRLVIVKKVSSTDEAGRPARLERARGLGELSHPNIVDVFEILDLPAGLFLVFEYANGRTVGRLLAKNGPFPMATAVKILKPVAGALEFAHGRGVIHANVKPSNIVVMQSGYVKLMDFALDGEPAGPSVDVAGLAATLYEMVAGEVLPDGPYAPVSGRIAGISPAFDGLMAEALAAQPALSIAEFSARLDKLV